MKYLERLRAAAEKKENVPAGVLTKPTKPSSVSFDGAVPGSKNILGDSLDLEQRIRAMAGRWGYSATELAEELAFARENPPASRRWVDLDEAQWQSGRFIPNRGRA